MGLSLFSLVAAFASMTSPAITSKAVPAAIALFGICLFGSSFSLSLGPIPNIISAEVFPSRARAAAMAASLWSQFAFQFVVGYFFPILRYRLGTQAIFSIFGVMCAACWLFVDRFVPETKGASLEQLGRSQGNARGA